jgi:antitoxin component YwqK of YwqJK toxin-antitoxin module
MTLSFYFGDKTGTYSGETASGLPNGYGTFSTQNEEGILWTYEGEWADGHFEGEGTTYWENGCWETGMYAYDALNGPGSEYWGDTIVYEGNYLDGIYDGFGKLYNIWGTPMYAETSAAA